MTDFNKVRLVAFYKKHNPSKLDTIDAALTKFAGREQDMIAKLEKKYGENLSTCWLTEFYLQNNPVKVDDVAATLEKYNGKEEELFRKLEKKYGPFDDGSDTKQPDVANEEEEEEDASAALKQRLSDFYSIHNPDKLDTVDATVEKFVGRDEELFAKLDKKYGTSSSSAAAAAPATVATTTATATTTEATNVSTHAPEVDAATGQTLAATATTGTTTAYSSGSTNQDFNKKRMIAMYTKNNPTKLDSIDAMLTKYAGNEETMFEKLETKYGENPTAVWLAAFYTQYNPARLPTVDGMMNKYKGDEEHMFTKLTTKYNDPPAEAAPVPVPVVAEEEEPEVAEVIVDTSEPVTAVVAVAVEEEEEDTPAPVDDVDTSIANFNRDRLNAFYLKHNPDKIESVETTLEKFAGREDDMFAKLAKKYGENPTKPWLVVFYEDHNPEKLDQVDATLDKYHGKEIALYNKLTKKYAAAAAEKKATEATRAMERQESERLKIDAEAMQEQLEKEERDIAILEQEAAGAVAIGTASLRTMEDLLLPSEEEETAAAGAVAVVYAPPAGTHLSEPTDYHYKILELIDDVQQGQAELETEYIKEHGTNWADNPEILFKYSDMVKRMTKIKQGEINDELPSCAQIDHVIVIDEIPATKDPIYHEHEVDHLGPYGDDFFHASSEEVYLSHAIDFGDAHDEDDWKKYYVRNE